MPRYTIKRIVAIYAISIVDNIVLLIFVHPGNIRGNIYIYIYIYLYICKGRPVAGLCVSTKGRMGVRHDAKRYVCDIKVFISINSEARRKRKMSK